MVSQLYNHHLNATDHGEAGEKTKGATDHCEAIHEGGLGVLGDQVKCGAVDEDCHHMKVVLWPPA